LTWAGPVDPDPLGAVPGPDATGEGFDPHEDRAGAAAHVLAVLTVVVPGPCRDRGTDVAEELVGLLVHTDHRTHRVIDPGVDRQNVFHAGRELRIHPPWDGPALLQMRTQFRLFKIRPMVEWSSPGCPRPARRASPAAAATTGSSPPGGWEHAIAISRASASPVTGEGTGGNSRCLRPIVACTSPPVSAHRFETNRTVSRETPAGRRPRRGCRPHRPWCPTPAAPTPAGSSSNHAPRSWSTFPNRRGPQCST
jgi:hypothetical protein